MASDQNIIVKKLKPKPPEGHGGAWKIAYADFVTAMMAFFLLLWLLNATEQQVLEGISNYFTPTTRTSAGDSGSGGFFGGISANDPGLVKENTMTAALDASNSAKRSLESKENASGKLEEDSSGDVGEVDATADINNFNTTKKLLQKAIEQLPPELEDFKKSIKVDITDDGLRVQLIDQDTHELFRTNSAEMTDFGKQLIKFVSTFIERLPNKISMTGYTNADTEGARNWKLSIDRALSTKVQLKGNSIPEPRFVIVRGAGDISVVDDPKLDPKRRVVIVLLRRAPVRSLELPPNPPSITSAPAEPG